jgi:hypothetical protein
MRKKALVFPPDQQSRTVVRGDMVLTMTGKRTDEDKKQKKKSDEFKRKAANLLDQPMLISRSKILYVSGASLRDVAIAMDLPLPMLERAAEQNGWHELRRKAQSESEETILNRIRAQAPKIMEKQLETSSKIINKVRSILDEDRKLSASELETLARSHKTTADVDARVIGLDRKNGGVATVNVLISSDGAAPIGDVIDVTPAPPDEQEAIPR